jgi:hypothetical protein
VDAPLAAVGDDRPGRSELDALARRMLRAMLEARVSRRDLGKRMTEA